MNTLPVSAANAPSALDARGASLLVRPDIFRADTRSLELTSGVSILAAVRQAMRQSGLKIPLRMIEIYAAANEHSPLAKVPREHWHTRLVKHGEFLQVVVAVRGGGGGGKNPLRTILSIVVVVVAAIASVYCPPLLGFTAGTIGASIAGAVAGAVVMMGGMLLVNAIAPMSTPKLGSASNLNAERIWSEDGIQNRFDPYGKVPLVLGKVRFAPRFAASP